MIIVAYDDFTSFRAVFTVHIAGVVTHIAIVGPVGDKTPPFILPYHVAFYDSASPIVLAYVHDYSMPLALGGMSIRVAPDEVSANDMVFSAPVEINCTGPSAHWIVMDATIFDRNARGIVKLNRSQGATMDVQVSQDDIRGGPHPGAKALGPKVTYFEAFYRDKSGLLTEVPVLKDSNAVSNATLPRDDHCLARY